MFIFIAFFVSIIALVFNIYVYIQISKNEKRYDQTLEHKKRMLEEMKETYERNEEQLEKLKKFL